MTRKLIEGERVKYNEGGEKHPTAGVEGIREELKFVATVLRHDYRQADGGGKVNKRGDPAG